MLTLFSAILAMTASMATAQPTRHEAEGQRANIIRPRSTFTGEGTVYFQGGSIGSCGHENDDTTLIAALGNYWMNNEPIAPYCGDTINVTNVGSDDNVGGKGNTITVTVADTSVQRSCLPGLKKERRVVSEMGTS